jgi:hypothetical protein
MLPAIWLVLPLADVFPRLDAPDLVVDKGFRQVVAGVIATLGLALGGLWLALRFGRAGKR